MVWPNEWVTILPPRSEKPCHLPESSANARVLCVLTPDQITAIAPDAASLKAGRDLVTPRKWQVTGGDAEVLWGLAMGSGKEPYQTRVSLADFATKCSCPSRKFPCKHALGLMFIATGNPAAFEKGATWLRPR
jgi:hypothetical protein